jgi:hypothetical protein
MATAAARDSQQDLFRKTPFQIPKTLADSSELKVWLMENRTSRIMQKTDIFKFSKLRLLGLL